MFKLDDRITLQLNSRLLSAFRYPRMSRLLQLRQAIAVAINGYESATTIRVARINGVATNYSIIYVWSVSLAQIIEVYLVIDSDMYYGLTERLEEYV